MCLSPENLSVGRLLDPGSVGWIPIAQTFIYIDLEFLNLVFLLLLEVFFVHNQDIPR